MKHTIYMRGIPDWPDVNIRNQPGLTDTHVLFRAPKGWRATCSEVCDDPSGDHFEGQTYRWFFLTFADGQQGWARDDLLDLEGDCTSFGYGFYPVRTYAFVASGRLGDPEDQPVVFTEQAVCEAHVRRDIQSNVRAAPTIQAAQVGTLDPGLAVSILDVVDGDDPLPYRWIKVRHPDVAGYIREDLLVYSEACAAIGLRSEPESNPPVTGEANVDYRLEAPIKGSYWVTQEYAQPGGHRGVDLAATVGTGVYASGKGEVAYTVACTRCTANAPNFKSQGLSLWDAAAIADPAWGYGFGHHVVVRYAWQELPKATRDRLTLMSLSGAFAYVIYAHLSSIDVMDDETVRPGDRVGAVGNTGNSSGPHLHLEVRISLSDCETDLFNRQIINPRDMFTL